MHLDATLQALSDPARRRVIELLRRHPERASAMADALGLSRPAMSKHLKVLRASGLVESVFDDADARARVYRLRPEPFTQLHAWLQDVEQLWTLQLASFATHATKRRGRRT